MENQNVIKILLCGHTACGWYILDTPCDCQDVLFSCGYTDYEHDHVECNGMTKWDAIEDNMRLWWNGRHAGFRNQWPKGRGGSNPPSRT